MAINHNEELGGGTEFDANADQGSTGSTSTANAMAHGGTGGQAVNLTYVDNYSTLMLVYTFLQLLASSTPNVGVTNAVYSLTPLLQSVMEEEKKYRQSFLEAVQSLNR